MIKRDLIIICGLGLEVLQEVNIDFDSQDLLRFDLCPEPLHVSLKIREVLIVCLTLFLIVLIYVYEFIAMPYIVSTVKIIVHQVIALESESVDLDGLSSIVARV